MMTGRRSCSGWGRCVPATVGVSTHRADGESPSLRVKLRRASFPPALGDVRAKSGDGDEVSARDIQPGVERQAFAAGSCFPGALQIRPHKRCGGESVLFPDRGGLYPPQPGQGGAGGRWQWEIGFLQMEQSASELDGWPASPLTHLSCRSLLDRHSFSEGGVEGGCYTQSVTAPGVGFVARVTG